MTLNRADNQAIEDLKARLRAIIAQQEATHKLEEVIPTENRQRFTFAQIAAQRAAEAGR
jgi:hypothetical protein